MKNYDEEKAPVLTFDHTVKIEVFEPDFEPLSSVKSLDIKKLTENDQKIEIGHMKGGCCDQLVYADIKDGMVVGIEVKPCEDTEKELPISEDLTALVSDVRKRLKQSASWEAMPVEKFVARINNAKDDIITGGGGTNCVWICVWRFGCLICCDNPPRCWTTPRGGNLLA